jgi:excinuclease ABC subunit A
VVDRLDVKASARRQLTDSVETSLALSGGIVVLDFVDLPDNDPHRERMYSEHLACLRRPVLRGAGAAVVLVQLAVGRLPVLHRAGYPDEVDPELVVSDPDKTLADGAIGPWSGGHVSDYFLRLIEALGGSLGFTIDTPWRSSRRREAPCCTVTTSRYTSGTRTGTAGSGHYYTTSGARSRTSSAGTRRPSDSSRERFAGFMREVPCPTCHGSRLKPIALAVTVDSRSISDYCALPIGELAKLLGLELSERDQHIVEPGS